MIIEELASAIFRAQAVSTCEWEDADEDIRESCRVYVRAVLPLIAAELAGVLRAKQAELRAEHAELRNAKATTDVLFLASQLARQVGEDALAIESHARKMGKT